MNHVIEVNGATREVEASPWKRLLDVLREDLALTGTKEGCGEGECGACSVLLDGEVVNSCLVAVGQCHGRSVKTVEGLATGDVLHAVQRQLVACGGAQCGICTPGIAVCATYVVDNKLLDGSAGEAARASEGPRATRGQYLPVHRLPADRRCGDRRGARGLRVIATQYARPTELTEALELRARHPDWMVLAGGTDLMVSATHKPIPAGIIDLWRFAPLCGIADLDGELRIGSCATWLEIQRDPRVVQHFGILVAAA